MRRRGWLHELSRSPQSVRSLRTLNNGISLFARPSLGSICSIIGLNSVSSYRCAARTKSSFCFWSSFALVALFVPRLVLAEPSSQCISSSTVEPAGRQEPHWLDRQKHLNEEVSRLGSKAKLIFIGDSITEGWEREGKDAWQKYFAVRSPINLGVGGDCTQQVLWRLKNGNLKGLQPDAAVILIGTNNTTTEGVTPAQIAAGIAAIVGQLRSTLPHTKLILMGVFPREQQPGPRRGLLLQANQIVENLADGTNIFWLDIGNRFVNADGSIKPELMPDYLHLSDAGYEIWSEALVDELSRALTASR